MKITSKKCIYTNEIVTYQSTYEVRVQIKEGQIITLKCENEDGENQWWQGKTKKDQDIIDKLTSAQSNFLVELIEKEEFE